MLRPIQNQYQVFIAGLLLAALVPSTAWSQAKPKPPAKLTPIAIAKVERTTLVDFEKEILPILERSCTACHNTALDENGLVLEEPLAILKGGKRGPAVVAGKGAESLLIKVAAHLQQPAMPPPDNDVEAPALKPEELGLIQLWINQGATGKVTGKAKAAIAWQPLPPGVNPIFSVALTPDGQYVACGRANQIFVYHVPTGQVVTRLTDPKLVKETSEQRPGIAHLDIVQSLAFNPQGDLLASGAYREVKLWRRPSNVRKFNLADAAADAVRAVAVSPDGNFLATGGADASIKLWNLTDGKPARTLTGHAGPIQSLKFSADGAKLVSASLDKSIRVWNSADGAPAGRIDTPAPVNGITFTTNGAQLASAGADNLIRLWAVPTGPSATLADLPAPAVRMVVSPDKKWLAVAGADGKIAIVDLALRKVVKTLAGHAGGISSLSFNGTGNRLASVGADKALRLWDPAADQPLLTLTGPVAALSAVSVNPAGTQLVSGTEDGKIAIWKLDAAAPRPLAGDNGAPATVAVVSRDGKLLATGGVADGKPVIFVREIASGNVTKTLPGHEGPITALAFSADASKLISGSADKTARVWNLADNKELAKFVGHGGPITGVALNSDAQQAVSGAADNSLKSWTVADSKELKNFAGHAGPVVAVAMTNNNQFILSASADKTVRTWNPADGNQLRSLDHGSPATSLALSRDDARVAVAGDDKTVKVYQVSDNKLLATLAGHAEVPRSVSFSVDNTRLVTSDAKQALAWDSASGTLLESISLSAGVSSAAFGPDLLSVVLAGADKSLVVHQLHFERLAGDHAKKITGLAYAADGATFFTSSEDGTLRGFKAADGQMKFNANHGAPVHALAQSGDGKLLASAGEDKQIKIWTSAGAAGPKPLLAGFSGAVKCVSFSADNLRVIGGSAPEVIVFQVADGVAEQMFLEHTASVDALASAGEKGDLVISASSDKSVRLWQLSAANRLAGHTGPVNSIAAAGDGQLLSGSEDGTVKQWTVANGQAAKSMSHGAPVTSVAVRPDGQRFASASANNTIRLWNAPNGQQVAEMKGDFRAQRVVALQDRDLNTAKGRVKTRTDAVAAAEKDLPTKAEAAKKATDAKKAPDDAFAAKTEALKKATDEKGAADKLAAETSTVALKATEAQKTADEAAKKAADDAKVAATKAGDAKKAADAAKDNKELADAAAAAQKAAEEADANAKKAAEAKTAAEKASADAAKAAKEATDKATAAVKPVEDATKALAEADANKKKADKDLADANSNLKKATDLIPAAKQALTEADAEQKRIEPLVEAAKKAAADQEKPIRSLAFSADNSQLVSGGDNQVVYTWNATDGAPIESYQGHAAGILAVAFGPGNTLVTGAADKSAAVWDMSPAWTLERTIGDIEDGSKFTDRVLALDFSPDGQFLATGGGEPSRSGELKTWKVADGTLAQEYKDAHSDTIFGVEYSPDGKTLVSCGADKFVKIFNVADAKFIRSFEGHTHHVLGVSWMFGGTVLASAGADNVVKVWNVETGEQQRTIQGFAKQVTSIQFIGDTPNVVTSCGDKAVRIHKSNDGGNVRSFAGGTDFMYSTAVTPNGKIVASGGHDSVLWIWNGDNGTPIASHAPPKPAAKPGETVAEKK